MTVLIKDAASSYMYRLWRIDLVHARGTAEKFSYARPWKPVNSTDVWRYIECLLYMGEHIEKKHEEY
jgi:hypothetical protein